MAESNKGVVALSILVIPWAKSRWIAGEQSVSAASASDDDDEAQHGLSWSERRMELKGGWKVLFKCMHLGRICALECRAI